MSSDKYVSVELAQRMKQIVTLSCFIRAHLMAQLGLVKYFGGNGQLDNVDEAELARCIIQSQVATYKALTQVASVQRELGSELSTELKTLYKRKTITEDLTKFVLGAHDDGAISATEAHKILHPLHHEIADCMKTLSQRAEGVVSMDHLKNIEGVASREVSKPLEKSSTKTDSMENQQTVDVPGFLHDNSENLGVVPS
jgi:hypothetical protein